MAEPSDHDTAFAEATRVLRDNRAQLTEEMKELLLDRFARNLDEELAEARRLWEAGEPLDQNQQTAILEWLRPLIDHAKSTNKRLVTVRELHKLRMRPAPLVEAKVEDDMDQDDCYASANKRSLSPDVVEQLARAPDVVRIRNRCRKAT